jgi:hypothetical protein
MIDPDAMWPWIRIVVATGGLISVTLGLLSFWRSMADSKSARESSINRENALGRSEFWKEANRTAAVINSVDIDLGPADSRANEQYISEFNESLRASAYANLLYHQLNYFHLTHLYKDFLTPSERRKFNDWARYTLNCWIEKVEPLQNTLQGVLDGSEAYSDEFVNELRIVLVRPFKDSEGNPARKTVDLSRNTIEET